MRRRRVSTQDLKVSPGVAPAGFQEIGPALALDGAGMGDAVTGINRADVANVNPNSMLRAIERDRDTGSYSAMRVTKRWANEFHVKLSATARPR
jgi:hypothetical protein